MVARRRHLLRAYSGIAALLTVAPGGGGEGVGEKRLFQYHPPDF
jgi:hypothetical protein